MLTALRKHLLTLTILTSSILLSGCDTDNNNNTPVVNTPFAVVQTIDPSYVSSEVIFIDSMNGEVSSPYYSKTKSDYTLSTFGSDVYHIGRYGIDTIDKYQAEDYFNPAWSVATQDPSDSISRNPYNLIFASKTKAYLIRYGSPKVWIVDPSVTNSADFKIGEIDLSDYNPANNSTTPSPASAVISQGKLFIAMQRLSAYFEPNPAYVAVFDIATDTEIETNSDSSDGLKGILLEGINPLKNSLTTSPDGKVYVTTHDVYAYSGTQQLDKSTIEVIEPTDYSLETLITAADIEHNVSALINASVILSADTGYFYTGKVSYYPVYGEISTLYEFNPTTGAIIESEVAGTGTEHINYLGLDKNGFLWLSMINPATPGIDIIDSTTNVLVGNRLLTNLNPNVIRFLK